MVTELVDARLKRRLILLEKLIPDPNPGPSEQELFDEFAHRFTDAEINALADETADETLQARWAACPRRCRPKFSDLTDEQLEKMIENLQSANAEP